MSYSKKKLKILARNFSENHHTPYATRVRGVYKGGKTEVGRGQSLYGGL
jgi:hypothetical protein